MILNPSRLLKSPTKNDGYLIVVLAFCIAWLSFFVSGQAQENRNQFNQLLLPSSREAQSALQRSCQLWSVQPLRPTIVELQTHYPISIWLDRRIDSGQAVSLSPAEDSTTLGEELQRLVISCGAAGGLVENIYTIAPGDRLARIQRAAVVLHGQLASAHKSVANESREISWPDITSSNELLELIQRTWGIELVDAEIPHDLLHQGQLPRCSLATQLALLLGGFDLQATLETPQSTSAGSGNSQIKLRVQPLVNKTAWQDIYSRVLTPAQLNGLQKEFPQCTIETLPKNSTKLDGDTNAHIELLTLGLYAKRPPTKQFGKEAQAVWTFEIKSPIPVEAVLNNLADQLKFELVWSEECTSMHRNRLIKLKVDKATRQKLFEEVAQAAGLSLVDEKARVVVSPK
jgi:hypothetical protein